MSLCTPEANIHVCADTWGLNATCHVLRTRPVTTFGPGRHAEVGRHIEEYKPYMYYTVPGTKILRLR